jgi:ATP-binding cassette subfamily B protein
MEHFFVPLVIAGAMTMGGLLISRSVLSAPDLIVFLLYIGYITSPLTVIAQWVGQFQDAMAGFTRFMEVMDIEPEKIPAQKKEQICQRADGHLEFVNVSFRYGEELDNVLDNVCLDIEPGDSIAFTGSSGAGKTTLCSLIPRFYDLRAGKILLDGKDIGDIDLETLRRNIGVVAQDVYLFNGTVMENIAYGKPGAGQEEIVQAAKMAKAHDFIMELQKGYETEIGQRGIRLSGGQRQRLSIARAFLKDPPILILDEATSALDYENEKAIHESLEGFMKNRTVLIIAHRLSTVKKAGKVFSISGRGIEETRTIPEDEPSF